MADIQGLGELEQAIEEMNSKLRANLPQIETAAAKVVDAEIRHRVPHEHGVLDSHLETAVAEGGAVVQIADSAPGGEAHHAIFVEFGTSKMAAEPFFRPGIEAAKPKVAAAIIDGIQRIIEK